MIQGFVTSSFYFFIFCVIVTEYCNRICNSQLVVNQKSQFFVLLFSSRTISKEVHNTTEKSVQLSIAKGKRRLRACYSNCRIFLMLSPSFCFDKVESHYCDANIFIMRF